jgi:hypothetical protein
MHTRHAWASFTNMGPLPRITSTATLVCLWRRCCSCCCCEPHSPDSPLTNPLDCCCVPGGPCALQVVWVATAGYPRSHVRRSWLKQQHAGWQCPQQQTSGAPSGTVWRAGVHEHTRPGLLSQHQIGCYNARFAVTTPGLLSQHQVCCYNTRLVFATQGLLPLQAEARAQCVALLLVLGKRSCTLGVAGARRHQRSRQGAVRGHKRVAQGRGLLSHHSRACPVQGGLGICAT